MDFPLGVKGYKLYDIARREFFISRDVLFFEELFPFHSIKEKDIPISHNFLEQFVILSPLFDCLEKEVITNPFTDARSMTEDTLEDSHGANDQNPYTSNSKETNNTNQAPILTMTRKSSWPHHPPSYLKDFRCNLTSQNSTPFPLNQYRSYNAYSQHHRNYLFNVTSIYEPTYYHQAVKHQTWRKAMALEIEATKRINTWTIVSLPKDHHTVGSKWVYKVKCKPDGTIDRYKARLVAKGYNQQEGIEFSDTFSPVAKISTVKIFLALTAAYNWSISQMDINNAFLNGDLFEEVHITLPLQTSQVPKKGEKLACKLNKSIYDLKQASRQWFLKFAAAISSHGFIQSKVDYSLFTRGNGSTFVALLVYVDDLLLTGPSPSVINSVKNTLKAHFKLKDLGKAKYFLGLELSRSQQGLMLSQRKYCLQILEDTRFLDSKPVVAPMDSNLKLCKSEGYGL
ncbi:hypothetical protein IC582_003658 [Cucumis melo]